MIITQPRDIAFNNNCQNQKKITNKSSKNLDKTYQKQKLIKNRIFINDIRGKSHTIIGEKESSRVKCEDKKLMSHQLLLSVEKMYHLLKQYKTFFGIFLFLMFTYYNRKKSLFLHTKSLICHLIRVAITINHLRKENYVFLTCRLKHFLRC